MSAFLDQVQPGENKFSEIEMVSFGEFVTLIWSLDEQRRNGLFKNETSILENNLAMPSVEGDYQDISGILNLRIDQNSPDIRREQFIVEEQTPGLGDHTPDQTNDGTPGLRKALRTDKKNKTEL